MSLGACRERTIRIPVHLLSQQDDARQYTKVGDDLDVVLSIRIGKIELVKRTKFLSHNRNHTNGAIFSAHTRSVFDGN